MVQRALGSHEQPRAREHGEGFAHGGRDEPNPVQSTRLMRTDLNPIEIKRGHNRLPALERPRLVAILHFGVGFDDDSASAENSAARVLLVRQVKLSWLNVPLPPVPMRFGLGANVRTRAASID